MTKARDQDLFYFFNGFQENFGARRFLTEKFKANYDTVRLLHNARLWISTDALLCAALQPSHRQLRHAVVDSGMAVLPSGT